jgi:hypothetical protein
MAGGKGRPKKSPRKNVKYSDLQQEPGKVQQVTPRDQMAHYYGGRAAMDDAIAQAEALSNNVYPAMRDIDPEMAEMFPPVDYDDYGVPVGVRGIDTGMPEETARSVGYLDAIDPRNPGPASVAFGGDEISIDPRQLPLALANLDPDVTSYNFPGGNSSDATMKMVDQPLTSAVTDPLGIQRSFGETSAFDNLRGTPLLSEDDAEGIAQALLGGSQAAGSIQDLSTPQMVDQTLANLRRGASSRGMPQTSEDFSGLLNVAMREGQQAMSSGQYPGQMSKFPGITLAELIAMANLPKRVQGFLPTRMGMIPSVMGAATAAGAAGQMGQQQNPLGSTMRGMEY